MDSLNVQPDARLGQQMHDWMKDLFPICRSITGPGVRETLAYFRRLIPTMKIHSVPSGTPAFDWTVPDEWRIRGGFLEHEDGTRIVDFANHNLHVVGYSEPVDGWFALKELEPHLYSLPEQSDAIPYVTSYYRRHWGFCLPHRKRQTMKPGRYRAVIDSTLAPGELNYGEIVIPGQSDREIFLSTYICHPSMANNELSGPVVAAALAQWLMTLKERRYTYRIVFIPETIGAIVYLSKHLAHLKAKTDAGFVLTCLGDERTFSYLSSRLDNTLADRVARHVLDHLAPGYRKYSYLARGSDERQYCAPGVDLPVCLVMRSMFGEYPEYHTSLDNLDFVTPEGLAGGYKALRTCIEVLEANRVYRATVIGEPQLGKRNLYPDVSRHGSYGEDTRLLKDTLAYCDGNHDLVALAGRIGRPAWIVAEACERLRAAGLLAIDED